MGTSSELDRIFAGLDPRHPTPLYEQIATCIRVGIAAGDLAEETALPSVRHLASSLRVNPSTVVQAYRDLEGEGFVYTQRGRGTYVAAITVNGKEEEQDRQAHRLVNELLQEAARAGIPGQALLQVLTRRIGAPTHV